ncbi:16S rRNA (adenine(1518)-N(6)/adenine(1519)-N(6))-dimethyltransferase RsmA [Hwanghaeella grinnelliae]|uniref:Ribosomal RNA small subunit methyltransferase A n=1 Tax=Hwanghaeella grinnelliae TaxID=2500179 RepID=A0A3S2ZB25_9PROT|nr:16S rRNA (adenine(1518)-N(6)/adenine(1519)-N(6))-dimethyltransferase RsmA [Hwanghaeella grinnelliae]RVU38477.1 16S rRNA (adenine(1518)-N(6)/adenine(1519)-N(6))-dimethyltransferase RsmA [Hwanghaeella grinnelliae]
MNDPVQFLPPLRDVIAEHGLAARKGLGQHFLLDLNLTLKIARAAGDLTVGTTVEVGPGPGGLTRAILTAGADRLIAIEKDERCIAALAPLVDAAGGRMTLLNEDALKVDYRVIGAPPIKIISNLPYNVGTPLLVGWLEKAEAISSMTLMFQKEVAERITARPGTDHYGRLSVLCNWRCRTDYLFTLPARAFTPPPKVDSAVVQLTPYDEVPYPGRMDLLQRVTAAAFGQRRKTLRRSLKQLGVPIDALLERSGIDGSLRAETIDIEGFGRLTEALEALQGT